MEAIQEALIKGEIDLAVHSLKDMSAQDHPDFPVVAVLPREDPRDVWIGAESGRIGTSSPRRAGLLKCYDHTLDIRPIRGNVPTRIEKYTQGEYDGIILAAAGLIRLGLAPCPMRYLDPSIFIPAPGQGVIGIQAKRGSKAEQYAREINHEATFICASIERQAAHVIGASCLLPFGAYAHMSNGYISLRAGVFCQKTFHTVIEEQMCRVGEHEHLAKQVVHEILNRGGRDIIRRYL